MIVLIFYPDSTGHLALATTGLKKNLYLSYFPPKDMSGPGFRLHKFIDDQEHRAGTIVVLPTIETLGYGLSEQGLFDWFAKDINPKSEEFNWFSNNCAGKVFEALCAAQLASGSLGNRILLTDFPFWKTPSTVISYATKLARMLLSGHKNEDEAFIKCQEIMACCTQDLRLSPHDLAAVIFEKIRKVNDDYSLVITKPYCDGIKMTLNDFARNLPQNLAAEVRKVLMQLSATDQLHANNFDEHFNCLHKLSCHLAGLIKLVKPGDLAADAITKLPDLLALAIRKNLILKISKYLQAQDFHMLQDRERIDRLLSRVKNLVDDNHNPHAAYFKKGDNMRADHPGIGYYRVL